MSLVGTEENSPDVSIIVPVYNRGHLIERALDSLIQQKFDCNYEIVVVDDGSTDDSACRASRCDPRIQVVRKPHRGTHQTRKTGAEVARGDYLAFLDSDDMAEPNHLAAHHQKLTRTSEAVLSFGTCCGDSNLEPSVADVLLESLSEEGLLINPIPIFFEYGGLIHGMNIMIRRELFLDLMREMPDYSPAEDMGLFLNAAFCGPFVYVDRPTIFRELRDDSVSVRITSLQDAGCLLSMYDIWMRLNETAPCSLLDHAFQIAADRYWPTAMLGTATYRQWDRMWRLMKIPRQF